MFFTTEEKNTPSIAYAKKTLNPQLKIIALSVILALAFPFFGLLWSLPYAIAGILNMLYIGSSTYLLGINYGIGNDLLACRNNIVYFTKGHNYGQEYGLVKTDNPNVNAIAWGITATHPLALAAGIIFGIAGAIAFFAGAPFIAPILLILPIGALAVGIGAHFYSKHKLKQYNARYSSDRKSRYSPTWHSNSDRNLFGYIALPLTAIVGLIVTITVSALHISLPIVLLSLPFQIIPGVLPATLITIGVLYFLYKTYKLKKNPNQQSEQFTRDYPKTVNPLVDTKEDVSANIKSSPTKNNETLNTPTSRGLRIFTPDENNLTTQDKSSNCGVELSHT